jgi:hypothetical protein
MDEQDARVVFYNRPYLVVAESDREGERGEGDSSARLFAQMRHLQIQQ